MPDTTNKTEPSHAEKFSAALTEILSVSKAEIVRREAEAKHKRASKRANRESSRLGQGGSPHDGLA